MRLWGRILSDFSLSDCVKALQGISWRCMGIFPATYLFQGASTSIEQGSWGLPAGSVAFLIRAA